MDKWTHVVEMKFEIELIDGTRIGGSGGGLEIGGIDANLTALKDPITEQPYLPGSSLKGKLRSTMEKIHGKSSQGEPCRCGEPACPVCPIFGAHMNTRSGASRLTVRDARFTPEYAEVWNQRKKGGLLVFEEKTENIIDRQRGTAKHPRTQERVPAGARFLATMLLKVFEREREEEMLKNLKNGLAVLQRCESLGAGGSRGSGQIAIHHFNAQKTVGSRTI